jgi:hypothetical protein
MAMSRECLGGLLLEPVSDVSAVYAADRATVQEFRKAPHWHPSDDSFSVCDRWEIAGDVIDAWQASGGPQQYRRRARLYLVRLPDDKAARALYPVDQGRWVLRTCETIGPAAGYGLTFQYRGEDSARAGVERRACSAQGIGQSYLGLGLASTTARDALERVMTQQQEHEQKRGAK